MPMRSWEKNVEDWKVALGSGEWDEQHKIGWRMEDTSNQQRLETYKWKRERDNWIPHVQ